MKKEIKCCKECECQGFRREDGIGAYHTACNYHDGSCHNKSCECHFPTPTNPDWKKEFDKRFYYGEEILSPRKSMLAVKSFTSSTLSQQFRELREAVEKLPTMIFVKEIDIKGVYKDIKTIEQAQVLSLLDQAIKNNE